MAGFGDRHGDFAAALVGDQVRLHAADGAEAAIAVPFPPLPDGTDPLADLERHLGIRRRLGAVLVRRGGYAVGVFDGVELEASKVGSAYVQGRTKAGGWSQQRYARRRDNQARHAYAEATEQVVRILLPRVHQLAAVATGGDQSGLAAVLADPRLAELRALVLPEVHPVPDPRLRVLRDFPERFLAVRIELNELA